MIPQILRILSEVKLLRTEGLEMSGAEYKEMIITDICRCKVQTNITVALALMFRCVLFRYFLHKYTLTYLDNLYLYNAQILIFEYLLNLIMNVIEECN